MKLSRFYSALYLAELVTTTKAKGLLNAQACFYRDNNKYLGIIEHDTRQEVFYSLTPEGKIKLHSRYINAVMSLIFSDLVAELKSADKHL